MTRSSCLTTAFLLEPLMVTFRHDELASRAQEEFLPEWTRQEIWHSATAFAESQKLVERLRPSSLSERERDSKTLQPLQATCRRQREDDNCSKTSYRSTCHLQRRLNFVNTRLLLPKWQYRRLSFLQSLNVLRQSLPSSK